LGTHAGLRHWDGGPRTAGAEYLTAENRILKAQLNGRLKLSDAERSTLGEIGHRLGRTALAEVATVAKPDTILAWYRKLVAHKFDGSKARRGPGRPRVARKVEQLIVRLAKENRDWGYDRIAGALANLGYRVSHQTVGNVLQRHGLPPAPERKRTTTWSAFIRIHLALLAGTDFFTAEVLTLRGLMTYYGLFFKQMLILRRCTLLNNGVLAVSQPERAPISYGAKRKAANPQVSGSPALRSPST
jgi:putative transposase